MNCQEAKKSLFTYLDGQLAATREQALYQHLSLCSGCQRELVQAREMGRLLEDALRPVDPPSGLVGAVMQALEITVEEPAVLAKEVCPARSRRRFFPLEAKGWLVAGVLAMLLGAGSLYLNQDNKYPPPASRVAEGEPAGSPEQEITPENVAEAVEPVIKPPAGEEGTTGKQPAAGGQEKSSQPETGPMPATGIVNPQGNSQEASDGAVVKPAAAPEIPAGRITIAGMGQVSQGVQFHQLVVDSGDNMNPVWADGGKKISFLSKRPGSQNYQLWQVDADGQHAEPVPGDKGISISRGSGVWQPGGARLAYVTQRENRLEIWESGPAAAPTGLTPAGDDDVPAAGDELSFWAYWPAWSSSGELAYLTTRYGGGSDVMLLDKEGVTRSLTRTADAQELYPAWSPDGERLAFYRSEKGSAGERLDRIVVLGKASGAEQYLTPAMGGDVLVPAWSPSGQQLAVNVGVTEPRPGVAIRKPGLWVINADGSGLRLLASPGGGAGALVEWSPDGQQVAFTDAAGALYVVRLPVGAASPKVLQVTPAGGVQNAVWSSDSRQLIMDWTRDGQRGIWVAALPEQFNP